jgi:hypothetical protein
MLELRGKCGTKIRGARAEGVVQQRVSATRLDVHEDWIHRMVFIDLTSDEHNSM